MVDAVDAVSFVAGGHRFAVEARQVRGMQAQAPSAAAALSIETLLGLPPGDSTRRKQLLIGGKGECVEVGEPVEFEALPASNLFPLPAAVASRLSLRGIKGLAMMPSGVILIVDLEAILP